MRRLELGSRVCFHGQIRRGELLLRIAGADAMLFPSLLDSAPSAVGEALQAGIPVVCVDQSGVAYLARQSGLEPVPVERDVPAALARALQQVSPPLASTRWDAGRLPALLCEWYEAVGPGAQRSKGPACSPS